MPHLSFEYSRGLGARVDLPGFVEHMRREMIATDVLPEPGIRIRGFEADHAAVADGGPHHFLDMVLRLGEGRDAATRAALADRLYAAARAVLEPQVAGIGFLLSLEVVEIRAEFARKAFNTLRTGAAG